MSVFAPKTLNLTKRAVEGLRDRLELPDNIRQALEEDGAAYPLADVRCACARVLSLIDGECVPSLWDHLDLLVLLDAADGNRFLMSDDLREVGYFESVADQVFAAVGIPRRS